jgi:hypothetical protein
MSTEPHKPEPEAHETPRHTDVSFEPKDVDVGVIYRYLFVLALVTAGSLILCIYILRYTTHFVTSIDAPPPQSRLALGNTFEQLPPEPRLQGVPGHETDPQKDLREKLSADQKANDTYGWVDKSAGIARIPVKDAVKILAEKGLSVAASPSAGKK